MKSLLNHPNTRMVYVPNIARRSGIYTPTRIGLALTLLVLKPTCGPEILAASLSAFVILALRMLEQLLLW